MKGYLKRDDDFQERRKKIATLSDEELKIKFWELAEIIVNPLLKMAKEYTTPSIERSILLRMGFSSLEVKSLVEGAKERGLMEKGVGHIVYRISKEKGVSIREAGQKLIDGEYWDTALKIFKEGR